MMILLGATHKGHPQKCIFDTSLPLSTFFGVILFQHLVNISNSVVLNQRYEKISLKSSRHSSYSQHISSRHHQSWEACKGLIVLVLFYLSPLCTLPLLTVCKRPEVMAMTSRMTV